MKRLKTVEYCFPHYSGMTATAGTYTSSSIPIFIPETGSRRFESVILETVCHDNESAIADDLTTRAMGISCNFGANWTDRNITSTLADTAENQGYIWFGDVTNEFTARFGNGTSGDCAYRYSHTYASVGQTFGNISAKLYITYEYEDFLADTRLKTVRIPIESVSGLLTSSQSEVGSTQIPALDVFLPESGKVYRDIFLELWTNTAPTSTTDYRLRLALSGESVIEDFTHTNAARSSYPYRYIWKRQNLNTSTQNKLFASASVNNTFNSLGGNLVVTYEYDHTNSPRIINSIILGLGESPGFLSNISSGYQLFIEKRLFDEKNIELKQSAIFSIFTVNATSSNIYLKAGNQDEVFYPNNAQASQGGQVFITHRVDSGALAGQGVYLNRGYNLFSGFWRASAAVAVSNPSAIIYLNYDSDKYELGDGANNHSVFLSALDTQRAAATSTSVTTGFYIPESGEYFLLGNIFSLQTNTAATAFGAEMIVGTNSSDIVQPPQEINIWSSFGTMANERQPQLAYGMARKYFKRYPFDPDESRISILDRRLYGYRTVTSSPFGFYGILTYSANPYYFTGIAIGYEGDGSGLPVKVYRADDQELVYSSTTNVGGLFTGSYFYGNIDLYAEIEVNHKFYNSEHFKLDNNQLIEINFNTPEIITISI